MPSNRESTRLPPANYLGQKVYFITVCCDYRHPYLADSFIASQVIEILHGLTAKLSFLLHAYCAMPDHLHFLVQGLEVNSDLFRLMKEFKSRTAYSFKNDHNRKLWEMSYYDHILRKPADIESVASYIWNNPVRKGLCHHPKDFPFSGSRTIDRMKSAELEKPFIPPWKPIRPV